MILLQNEIYGCVSDKNANKNQLFARVQLSLDA